MTTTRYTIEVEGARADQELARLHRSSTTLAGTEKTLETAVKQTNTALTQQAPAAAKAGMSMEATRKSADKLAGVLGKQAAAIALVSQHLGEGNGKMGEAVKGAGMMAAAFGAGGPYAAALVAGIALIGQFNKHLERKIELQDQELAKTFEVTDAISARTIKLRKENDALRRELNPEMDRDARRQELADLMAKNAQEEESLRRRATGTLPSLRAEAQANIEKADFLKAQNKEIAAQLQLMTQVAQKGKEVTPKTGKAKAPDEVLDPGPRFTKDMMAAEAARQAIQAYRSLSMQDEVAYQQAIGDVGEAGLAQRMRTEEAFQAQMRMQEEADFQMRKQAHESFWHEVAGYSMTATGIMASASTQLLADLIGGQEKALERFGISIMAQAGQALVSYGIQGIGSGLLQTSLGNPAGLGQIAVGTGLVAAGVGLGGVAGGLSGLMGGSTETQRPLPGAMASPIGAGGGGGNSVTIVYGGMSGPTAEQGAENLIGGLRKAQSRNHSGGRESR